jgi:hypothetical protein
MRPKMRLPMRNWTAQALAPGSTLTIPIDPPIAEHERHYVVTGLGPGSIVVRVIDTTCIEIANPTRFVAPFALFIGPKTFLPPALSRLARILGNY